MVARLEYGRNLEYRQIPRFGPVGGAKRFVNSQRTFVICQWKTKWKTKKRPCGRAFRRGQETSGDLRRASEWAAPHGLRSLTNDKCPLTVDKSLHFADPPACPTMARSGCKPDLVQGLPWLINLPPHRVDLVGREGARIGDLGLRGERSGLASSTDPAGGRVAFGDLPNPSIPAAGILIIGGDERIAAAIQFHETDPEIRDPALEAAPRSIGTTSDRPGSR